MRRDIRHAPPGTLAPGHGHYHKRLARSSLGLSQVGRPLWPSPAFIGLRARRRCANRPSSNNGQANEQHRSEIDTSTGGSRFLDTERESSLGAPCAGFPLSLARPGFILKKTHRPVARRIGRSAMSSLLHPRALGLPCCSVRCTSDISETNHGPPKLTPCPGSLLAAPFDLQCEC